MEYLGVRLLCSFLAGVLLSQTGSLIQMGTRNILASPSTLGFDGLSILWILVAHSLMLFLKVDYELPMLLLFGIPCFVGIGVIFARFMNKFQNIERLVLLGLTFNLLVGAIFSLWQFLFLAFNLPFPIELWFGHFRFAELSHLLLLLLIELIILAGWVGLRREFYLYSLGKAVAGNWKLREAPFFAFMFIAVATGTFAVVTMFGAFSFLALIFPIIARRLWFSSFDLEGELLLGAVVNGLILMLIDFVCYFFPIYGAEVPVGLIATAIGALSLILLLWQKQKVPEFLANSKK